MSRSAAGTPIVVRPASAMRSVSVGVGARTRRNVAFEESAASPGTPLPSGTRCADDDASPVTPLPLARGPRAAFGSTPTPDAYSSSGRPASATPIGGSVRRPGSATVHPAGRVPSARNAWAETPTGSRPPLPPVPTPLSTPDLDGRRTRAFFPSPAPHLATLPEGRDDADGEVVDDALFRMPGAILEESDFDPARSHLPRAFATPGAMTPARGRGGRVAEDLSLRGIHDTPEPALRSALRPASRSRARTPGDGSDGALPPAPDMGDLLELLGDNVPFSSKTPAKDIYQQVEALSRTLVDNPHFTHDTKRVSGTDVSVSTFRFYLRNNHANLGILALPSLRINLEGEREDNIEYIGVRRAGNEYNLVIGIGGTGTEHIIPVRGVAGHAEWQKDVTVLKALLLYQISRLQGIDVRGARESYVSTVRQSSVREEARLSRFDVGDDGVVPIGKISGSRILPGAKSAFSYRNPLPLLAGDARDTRRDSVVADVFSAAEAEIAVSADSGAAGAISEAARAVTPTSHRTSAVELDDAPYAAPESLLPELPSLSRSENNSGVVHEQMKKMVGRRDPFIARVELSKEITGFAEAPSVVSEVTGRARGSKGSSKFLMMKAPDGLIDIGSIPDLDPVLYGKRILGIGVSDQSKRVTGGSYSYALLYEDGGQLKLYEVGSTKLPRASRSAVGPDTAVRAARFNEAISQYVEKRLLSKIFAPSLASLLESVAGRQRGSEAALVTRGGVGAALDPDEDEEFHFGTSAGRRPTGLFTGVPWAGHRVLPPLGEDSAAELPGDSATLRGRRLPPLPARSGISASAAAASRPVGLDAGGGSSTDEEDGVDLAGAAAAASLTLPGATSPLFEVDSDSDGDGHGVPARRSVSATRRTHSATGRALSGGSVARSSWLPLRTTGDADAVLPIASPVAAAPVSSASATGPRRHLRPFTAGSRASFSPLDVDGHVVAAHAPRDDASRTLRAGEADALPLLSAADLGSASAGAAAAATLTSGRPALVAAPPHLLADGVLPGTLGDDAVATLFDGEADAVLSPTASAGAASRVSATGPRRPPRTAGAIVGDGDRSIFEPLPFGAHPPLSPLASLTGAAGLTARDPRVDASALRAGEADIGPLLPEADLGIGSAGAAAAGTLTAGRPTVVLPSDDAVVGGDGTIPIAVAATPTRPFGAAFRGRDSDEDDDGLELVTMGRGRARSGSDPIGGASARHHPAVPPLRLPPSVGAVAPSPLLPHSRSASIDLGVVGAMTPPPALSLSAGPPIHIPLAPLPTVTSASASGSALPPLPVAPPLSASASGPVLPPPVSAAAPSATLVQRLAALRRRWARTPAPLAAAAPVSAAASVSAPAPAPAVPEISSVSLFRAMDPATTFAAPGAGRVAFYSIPAAVPAGVLPPRVGSKTLPSNNYRMVRSEKGIWIDVPPSEGIVGGPVNIKEFGVGDHNHLDMFGRGGHHAFAFKLPSGQIYEVPYDSAHAEVRKQIRVAIGREYVEFLRSEERAASVAAASASAAAGFAAPVMPVMNPDLSSTKIVSGAVEGITVPTMLDGSIKDDKLLERFKALPHREMRRAPGMRLTEVIYLAELSTPIDITVRASKAHVIGVRTNNGKFVSYCYLDEFGSPINAVSPDSVAVKSTLVKEIGFAELDRLSNTMPSFVFGTMQAAVTINDSADLKKRLEQKWMLEGGFSSKVKPHPKFVESDSPKDAEYLMMKISDVKVNFNLPKFPGRDSHISEIGIRTKNMGGVFGKKVFNYVVKTTNLAGEEIYYEIPLTDEKLNNLASATLSSLVVSAHQHTYAASAPAAPASSGAAPSLRAVSAAVRDIATIDRREGRRLLEDEVVSASFVRHREGVVEAAPGSVVSGAKAIPLSDYHHGYSVAKGTYRGDHDHENSEVMKAIAYAAIKAADDNRILGRITNADNLVAVAAAYIGSSVRKECALQGIYSSNTSTLGQGLDIGEMPDLAKRAFNKLMANPDKVALAAEAKEFLRKNAERVREAAGKSR